MKYLFFLLFVLTSYLKMLAQDSTEVFDASLYADATSEKKFCTQKVINQTPTKLIGIGYEHNFSFSNKTIEGTDDLRDMGGLRTQLNLLAFSTHKFILSVGLTYWGSKIRSQDQALYAPLAQVYEQRMDMEGVNLLMFKPLNERHFLLAQANADMSVVTVNNDWMFTQPGLTFYGSILFGWKKGDYRMMALGLSRTYRMGRPLIVPVFLYNKTFNDRWGIEALLPARGHVRYNFSTNSMLLAGYELEGQQFDLIQQNVFLQRGEIKPRLMFEKKLVGFFWLSAQAGYRINGRFNFVDRYDGQEKHEIFKNTWGGSPYFNLSINFVSP